jgi:CheY-like chemotaxis protein
MKKILIVDDERIFHFLSTKIIEVCGIPSEISSAYDGAEALTKLNNGLLPDFILVDLDMPNMNGFEFLERFKRTPDNHAKVIVLSSSNTEDERKRALELGADLYMSKPLTEANVNSLFRD